MKYNSESFQASANYDQSIKPCPRQFRPHTVTMFRRIASTLPQDVIVPANLEAMGYFLNDDDQIRQIRNPEQAYQFKVNANDRINDMYKEAMNSTLLRVRLSSSNEALRLRQEHSQRSIDRARHPDSQTTTRYWSS